jgi:hypothetical protein
MKGACDTCDRQNVELSRGSLAGMEAWTCAVCSGDHPNAYGELDEKRSPGNDLDVSAVQRQVSGGPDHREISTDMPNVRRRGFAVPRRTAALIAK